MTTTKRAYGWKPQLPDFRDQPFTYALGASGLGLPAVVDLRPHDCPIKDQGGLGSCTAHAIAGAFEFSLLKQGLPYFAVSRLALYYMERLREGTVSQDAGAQLRDGLKVVNKQGVALESLWPYVEAKFKTKLPAKVTADALKHLAVGYQAVRVDLTAMRGVLAQGLPIVVGFTAYPELESPAVAQTGNLPMPTGREAPIGGHAVKVVGYDDNAGHFIVANSWGTGWGDKGYFYMPYAYLANPKLASDFWVIQAVTE